MSYTYNHELYLRNCRKMIRKNKEQLKDALLRKERQDGDPEDLDMEIEGWQKWVKIWEDRLETALKIGSKG